MHHVHPVLPGRLLVAFDCEPSQCHVVTSHSLSIIRQLHNYQQLLLNTHSDAAAAASGGEGGRVGGVGGRLASHGRSISLIATTTTTTTNSSSSSQIAAALLANPLPAAARRHSHMVVRSFRV